MSESRSLMSDSLQPHGHPWDSPGQNTEVGSLSLLQGIRDQTQVSHTAGRFFTSRATRKAHKVFMLLLLLLLSRFSHV